MQRSDAVVSSEDETRVERKARRQVKSVHVPLSD